MRNSLGSVLTSQLAFELPSERSLSCGVLRFDASEPAGGSLSGVRLQPVLRVSFNVFELVEYVNYLRLTWFRGGGSDCRGYEIACGVVR